MSYKQQKSKARTDAVKRRLNQYGKPVKHPGRDYKEEAKYLKKHQKKRVAMNKYNRKKGTYGNGDKLDASHRDVNSDGKIEANEIGGFEKQSTNRARKK